MSVQLFVPTFDVDTCLASIRECLERGWTGAGFKTVEFEEAWREYTGHATAHFLNSATSALHLAVNVYKEKLGWQDGDEIITSPLTFVSTAHAVLYERMTPVFADVDEYLCLDPAEVEKQITPRTRAVIFVGVGGNTGQFEAVKELCRRMGLILILDAAHMAGTRVLGRTPEADAVAYSFHAVKNLPTGDAGMVCFADPEMDRSARKKSWLGISRGTYERVSGALYQWEYDVEGLGFKYNGNSVMAAIALAQLPLLERDNEFRRSVAERYAQGLRGIASLSVVPTHPDCVSSRHLFQVEVDNRSGLMAFLSSRHIQTGVHYHALTSYRTFAYGECNVPNACRRGGRVLSLPMHLRLTPEDVDCVIASVREYMDASMRS